MYKCPYCLKEGYFQKQPNEQHSAYLCPHCESNIPTTYVNEYFSHGQIELAMIGFSGHGKTQLRESLLQTLRSEHLLSKWPKFHSLALDETGLETIISGKELNSKGLLPAATPKIEQRPILLRLSNIPSLGNYFVSLFDVSGEAFESIDEINTFAGHILRSNSILFVVSPHDSNIQFPDISTGLYRLINTIILALNQHRPTTKAMNLIVVLTKADLLQNALAQHQPLLSYVQQERYEGIEHPYKYLDNLKEISRKLREFIRNEYKAYDFVNTCENNFKTTTYTLVSALGSAPTENGEIEFEISPKRVIDPLLILLSKVPTQDPPILNKAVSKIRWMFKKPNQ